MVSATHLKYKHNIGISEYIKNYGDIMTVEQRQAWKEKNIINHWSKKPLEDTKYIRDKCAKNGKRVMHQLNSEGRAHKFTTETSKMLWTEEHRELIKNKLTGLKRSDETKTKIKENHWTNKSPIEVEAILAKIFGKNGQIKNTIKGWFTSHKTGQKMFYMSSYELQRLLFLDNNDAVITFTTNHGIKIEYEFNGVKHFYIPDILVELKNGKKVLEEIKGHIHKDKEQMFTQKCKQAQIFAEVNGMEYKVVFKNTLELL
jgi:hypothetical protein